MSNQPLNNPKLVLIYSMIILFGPLISCQNPEPASEPLFSSFQSPEKKYWPGVYWYFMDGNMSKEGIKKDLEAMAQSGIGHVLFLEVNVGIPRGKVDFLSNEWQNLFLYAEEEAGRLGIKVTLGVGPGWTGSGGPWVKPEESMLHLVVSETQVSGPTKKSIDLQVPPPKKPYFGERVLTEDLKTIRDNYYEDVAVIAFEEISDLEKLSDIDEKALYYRGPYSSVDGILPFFKAPSPEAERVVGIDQASIVDLTSRLDENGSIEWEVPEGSWTILRFGSRNNGAVTRPAPDPGLGFEADKFDTTAIKNHLDIFPGVLLDHLGETDSQTYGGLKMLHMDSWEMGAQNWTKTFVQEFIKRRGYDPLPYFPVIAGYPVENRELSERFLWDWRITGQELILQNHASFIKKYARSYGFGLSIEPYDMNPTADLELGAIADVPMCEFWSDGYGFNSIYSCIEAVSIGNIMGKPVAAEAFTALDKEKLLQHPTSMKNQTDWAFAFGIDNLIIHTYQHQPFSDGIKPGMTMGGFGIHWHRNQTWWPMVKAYHEYIARCQFLLQQGRPVADILFLVPEGAPNIFIPPKSALSGTTNMPDRKGYNFDGCWPSQLMLAEVVDGSIVFPSGSRFEVLVLPSDKYISEPLLDKIIQLTAQGATVMGNPRIKSHGLSGYPKSDQRILELSNEFWGSTTVPSGLEEKTYGNGRIYWGQDLESEVEFQLFPEYGVLTNILANSGVEEDLTSSDSIRYTHIQGESHDIYFVSNTRNQKVITQVTFRSSNGSPELWDPVTGTKRILPNFIKSGSSTTIPLEFFPHESYFIVFEGLSKKADSKENFFQTTTHLEVNGPWDVTFDQQFGGPGKVQFKELEDWAQQDEVAIKYYSGIAKYENTFTWDRSSGSNSTFLDLGKVKNMAKVFLNGEEVGTVWTAPWRVEVSKYLREGENKLEIQIANLWANRLIGDANSMSRGRVDGEWEQWLSDGTGPKDTYAFITRKYYSEKDQLLVSGLLGPVTIQSTQN